MAAIRKALSLNQQDLAKKLGFPRTTWSSYEQGVSEPSISDLIRIADFFGIMVDSLIRLDYEGAPLMSKEELRKYRPKWPSNGPSLYPSNAEKHPESALSPQAVFHESSGSYEQAKKPVKSAVLAEIEAMRVRLDQLEKDAKSSGSE